MEEKEIEYILNKLSSKSAFRNDDSKDDRVFKMGYAQCLVDFKRELYE